MDCSRLCLIFAMCLSGADLSGSIEFAERSKSGRQCVNGPWGTWGPCAPGNEFCGKPFENAPAFHLMDQHGCDEWIPCGPVFDPVHGVIHYFYQSFAAAYNWGHFVSKDFVNWAALPVAIWNGLDSSVEPAKVTNYDSFAINPGSAFVLDGAGPGGVGPGVVNIYTGMRRNDLPASTGGVLAQAVPADYANDALLINWTKPSYNPVMDNTHRAADPSSPWKTPSGEWRLRTFDSNIYAAASDADVLMGKWYKVGPTKGFGSGEVPSFYPLPASTPGFEAEYDAAKQAGGMPTHVQKTSLGWDMWRLGTYQPGGPKELDHFSAAPGWEDVFAQRKIDAGLYGSKDNEYPTKTGGKRRINWGWAKIQRPSTQTLPREITFNAAARVLEQAPISELESLRQPAVSFKTDIPLMANTPVELGLKKGIAKQSEVVAKFQLPAAAAAFGIVIGEGTSPIGPTVDQLMNGTNMIGTDYNVTHYPPNTNPFVCEAACAADAKCQSWTYIIRGSPAGSGDCCLKSGVPCPTDNPTCTSGVKKAQILPASCWGSSIACTVDYTPPANASVPFHEVPVACGQVKDSLRLTPTEKTLEIRVFSDWKFIEAYFQKGRVAMTAEKRLEDITRVSLTSSAYVILESATAYPMKTIWTTPDQVRNAPRVYPTVSDVEVTTIV